MNIITLDFETFFADDFTLSKMTTEAYVRDPRFEVHGCAVRTTDGVTRWFGANELIDLFCEVNVTDGAILCHHAHFDGLILNHHFGIRPKFWLDTLSMARQQLGNHLSASLEAVRQHFGMPSKRTPYDLVKGKHWHELTPEVQRLVGEGACDEVESIWRLFSIMARDFPAELYLWVDNTVRMFTEPKLVGDLQMLGEVWQHETNHKITLLNKLGVTKDQLGSDEVLADLFRQLGVEPEVKTTAKGNVKYSFAKTDTFMQEVVDDQDDDVRALAEARLSVKSTLQKTRSERLGYMALRGPLCVYLSAFGAHTNRDSGGDKLNFQNFTRGSKLGKAVKAPSGFVKVSVDKSQIECRILNMFAGQWDVIERFRNKEDPYVAIASQFYGFTVTREHAAERGTGKQLELSCGYGAGAATIVHTARKGTYGPPVYLTDEQGERAKDLYRSTHVGVVELWRTASRMISAIAGTTEPIAWGCVEVRTGEIVGPGGSRLRYPELHYDEDAREWRYKMRRGLTKLYGGKLVENLIQWLAWVSFCQDIVRIGKESGLWPVIREHDKGVWLLPADQHVDTRLAYLKAEMSRPPVWMPELPLDADASITE